VATGMIQHHHIPDDPFVESERRQIFFATSIGLPTFFVHADSKNYLLRRILGRVQNQRHSRRYKGYIRVGTLDYQKACLQTISEEGGWLMESVGVKEELAQMRSILLGKKKTAAERLTKNILKSHGTGGKAMDLDAPRFNQAAERYYRTTLFTHHMEEGLRVLAKDGRRFDREGGQVTGRMAGIVTGGCSTVAYIEEFGGKVISGQATETEIQRLILLSLLIIEQKQRQQEKTL
jgi:hypothetical protein